MTKDYAIMAFRMYLGKIDRDLEDRFYFTLHYLMDIYTEDKIHEYVMDDKILLK